MTEALKSTSITNLDASPIVPSTAGKGAGARLHAVTATVTPSDSAATGSTYQFVRLASNVVLHQIWWESGAMTAGKFNLGAYYSSSTTDGTPASLRGTVIDEDRFATDIDCASAITPTNEMNESGTVTAALRNLPLWQMCGLSADPGGFIDIVATCHTTGVTTGAAIILTVFYAG